MDIDGVHHDIPTTQVGMSFESSNTNYVVRRISEYEAMISPSPVTEETTFGILEISGWRLKNEYPRSSIWVYPNGRVVASNGHLVIDARGKNRRISPYVKRRK